MYNGWNNYPPGHGGAESYPSPAPSPEVNADGIPLAPGAPRRLPVPLPPRPFNTPRPHLHPLLRYTLCPCILYDVRHPPSFASAPNARLEWAHESATNPPSSRVIITCHVLPRPFIVRPSGRIYDYVTIHDILLAVHGEFTAALRAAWAPGETASSPSSLLLLTGPPNVLSGRYIWNGLSEERAPGNWLLHVD
jgi:hypothetical protein